MRRVDHLTVCFCIAVCTDFSWSLLSPQAQEKHLQLCAQQAATARGVEAKRDQQGAGPPPSRGMRERSEQSKNDEMRQECDESQGVALLWEKREQGVGLPDLARLASGPAVDAVVHEPAGTPITQHSQRSSKCCHLSAVLQAPPGTHRGRSLSAANHSPHAREGTTTAA